MNKINMKTNLNRLVEIWVDVRSFRPRPCKEMSTFQLLWLFEQALKPFFWKEYLPLYQTLFVSEDQAIAKAKTHSIAVMCVWVHNKKGCSFTRLFDLIKKESSTANIFVSPDVLDISDKLHFIFSLCDLKDNPEQDETDFQ